MLNEGLHIIDKITSYFYTDPILEKNEHNYDNDYGNKLWEKIIQSRYSTRSYSLMPYTVKCSI